MQVCFSNRIERLFLQLKEALFSDSAPFTRRLIAVPSPAMKGWLTFKLASDPDLQVAAGVELAFLDEAIERLVVQRERPLPLFELALVIEGELRRVLLQEAPLWEPLHRYLRKPRRVAPLAKELASLFRLYALCGYDPSSGWQTELFQRLEGLLNRFNLERAVLKEGNFQLHLFAINFLFPRQMSFLQRLSGEVPVHLFLLSPCATFWSDLLSDKQADCLQRRWDVDEAPLLTDRHPLLANYGRVGREMAREIEEAGVLSKEEYALPKALSEHSSWEPFLVPDLFFEPEEAPPTLLEALQADLLLNRVGQERVAFPSNDRSIQLHLATSKMREVQILRDQLLALGVEPHEVVVMAPDILEYAPLIEAVFGEEESPFAYQIIEGRALGQEPLHRAFLQLLSFKEGRWDCLSLLQLVEQPSFLRRHQFGKEDVLQLREWIEGVGIRWGMSSSHRDQLLREGLCKSQMVERGEVGSWEGGFAELLEALVGTCGSVTIEVSKAELLGRWITVIRALYSALETLEGERPAIEWAEVLEALYCAFLSPCDEKGVQEERELLTTLARLRSGDLGGEVLPFSSILLHLRALLEGRSVNWRDNRFGAVRFCSLLPMRALPAKVVALLGMDEGAFPRSTPESSLNLLIHSKHFFPTRGDYDRYLFLELLLSVRQMLLISYVGSSDEGVLCPSPAIEELFAYLDKSYTLGGQVPSKLLQTTHPFAPYDARYFGGDLVSFSKRHYRAARAYYLGERAVSSPFIKSFAVPFCPLPREDLTLTLSQLTRCLHDPIGHYLRHRLGLFLKEKEPLSADEPFALSSLARALFKRSALRDERAVQPLPWGGFGLLAAQKMEQELSELQLQLKKLKITSDEIFSITLGETLEPLTVPYRMGRRVEIVGTLVDLTTKGALIHGGDDRSGMIKAWPTLLLLLAVAKREALKVEPRLLFLKNGRTKEPFFSDPFPHLQRLLDYYFLSAEHPSPLLPDWVTAVLNGDAEIFQTKVEASLSSQYFYQEAARWALQRGMPDQEALFSFWRPYAEALFGPLETHWFSKEGR